VDSRAARAWHWLTFVAAAAALVLQLVLVLQGSSVLDETKDPGTAVRTFRYFLYFTIQSNIAVAWVTYLLARGRASDTRFFRVLRLDAVLGIAVTGVVHFVLLRPLLDLEGASYVADKLLHMVVPAVAVTGWLVFGPRGLVSRSDVPPALMWPVAWLMAILLHGAAADWYPYPFIDVIEHGYAVVLVNSIGVTVLFLAVAYGLVWADRRLPRR
jgi:uncharacterized membrane protein YozB (DUF420 family)